MRKCGRVCEKRKLKGSGRKNKVLKFSLSGERDLLTVRVGSHELEKVMNFKY